MGEVVAAPMVYVPAQRVIASRQHSAFVNTGIFVSIVAVVMLLINQLWSRTAIHPLGHLAAATKSVSDGRLGLLI